MPLSSRLAAAALFAGTVFALPSLRADSLFWSNVNYAPTTAQAIQRNDLATINGNTVSLQFGSNSGTNNFFSTSVPSPAAGTYTAGSNTTYTNGGILGQRALQIVADFDNATGGNIAAGSSLLVTVFFTRPITNLSFSFYDVDNGSTGSGPYNDVVSNIFGLGTGGASVPPVSIADGTANGHVIGANSATITATGNSAQNAGAGNSTVTFGNTPITQFSFTYTDTSSAAGGTAHSTVQIMALGDLTFTTVPEPSTWTLAGAGGLLALGWAVRRRAASR